MRSRLPTELSNECGISDIRSLTPSTGLVLDRSKSCLRQSQRKASREFRTSGQRKKKSTSKSKISKTYLAFGQADLVSLRIMLSANNLYVSDVLAGTRQAPDALNVDSYYIAFL